MRRYSAAFWMDRVLASRHPLSDPTWEKPRTIGPLGSVVKIEALVLVAAAGQRRAETGRAEHHQGTSVHSPNSQRTYGGIVADRCER
jgi:hypothetical protein